jgi:hypothetical protein
MGNIIQLQYDIETIVGQGRCPKSGERGSASPNAERGKSVLLLQTSQSFTAGCSVSSAGSGQWAPLATRSQTRTLLPRPRL